MGWTGAARRLGAALLCGLTVTGSAAPAASQDTDEEGPAQQLRGSLTVESGDSLRITLEMESCEADGGRLTIEEEGDHPLRCRTWSDERLVFEFGAAESSYLCELDRQEETNGYVGPCEAAEDGVRLGRILIFPSGTAEPPSD